MPRPFKWGEHFHKGAPLLNRSNKYEVTCLKCQKKIPKGRSEDRTRHLLDECPGLTREERAAVAEVAAKDSEAAEAAAEGRNASGNKIKRPRIPWVKSDFTDGEITEFLRLVRVHHPVESEEVWAVVVNEYNAWAQGNGYKKHSVESLKKQWDSRVNNTSGIAPYNYPQTPDRFAWDLDDSEEGGITAIGGLGTVRNGEDTEPEANYNPSLIVTATPGPSYAPPQVPSPNHFNEIPPAPSPQPQPTPDERVVRRSLALNPKKPSQSSESSSLVKLLTRENDEKSKRIEKLEVRIEKLDDKVEKLEDKVEKLDSRNRSLESQNQMLKLQLIVARDASTTGGVDGNDSSVGGKRKRASSADHSLLSQLQEDGGGGGGGGEGGGE